MSIRFGIAFCLVMFVLAGCSETPPTVGEAVAFAEVCEQDSGKRVSLEGFLQLPDSFTGDQSVVLRMFETDAFDGAPVGVQMRFGNQPNQLEQVPTSYTDNDLQVHLNDGQIVGYGVRVKVSGSVYFPMVDQDFDCGLENPLVELAS